jgi:tetratricopeptide (TPR) repeat protein
MQVEKTVFISYRRTNVYTAIAVYQNLKANGYDVFLDFESIDSGAFSQVILNQIAARAHFILLATPSALQECYLPEDRLRKAIEFAVDTKRNIISLMFDKFDYEMIEPYLEGKLKLLTRYPTLEISISYFHDAVKQLHQLLNKTITVTRSPISLNDATSVRSIRDFVDNLPTPLPQQVAAEEYFERAFFRSEAGLEGDIQYYRKAIELSPKFEEAYYQRGMAYYRQGDLQKAIADFSEVIELNPQNAQAYSDRGAMFSQMNKIDRAIRDYDAAIRINPGFSNAYTNRGRAYVEKENIEAAMSDYNKAIELNPDDQMAYSNRATLFYEQGKFEAAIADFTQAIRLDPEDAESYRRRGNVYYHSEDLENAVADYSSALKFNPQDAYTYNNRGKARYLLGDVKGAITDYSNAIQVDKEAGLAYGNRGEAYFVEGNYKQALSDYEMGYKLMPEYYAIIAGLAVTYHVLNQTGRGIKIWRNLLKLDDSYKNPDWVKKRLNWPPELVEEARKLIAKL